ncbi:HEAT repeat domain-containing protein [Candidatus Laterigemmans baculatus]|uniref:HEAT repeat domain-containing protein n=1 Tax=Candidatus Laterigemmans baculatus TaxID=2770505 RepID=UPI0013DB5DC0|nr:HEAT repeat domain-containing protein [Candidatus Laterigemmans baculatus]
MRKFDAAELRETIGPSWVLMLIVAAASGCQDGPMFAIKKANPYYSSYEWAADEAIGPTDATREAELRELAGAIDDMSPAEQRRWLEHLANILQYDPSPHMRCQAVHAAALATVPEAISVLETGTQDDHAKVRIASCDALALRTETEATRLLAESVNSETNKDVRLAAIKSLGSHQGSQATDALKLALQEPELAYQHASIASLRQITGRDVGNEPEAWVAMLESPEGNSGDANRSPSWSERLGSFF